MPRSQSPLLRFIRSFRPLAGSADDANLLERYVRQADEAAFELLLWRHGGMVLGLCESILRDKFEAEDAFQAAFLVLARKARSIGKRSCLAAWLHQVTLRIALRIRKRNVKRSRREISGVDDVPQASQAADDSRFPAEWRPVLHEEIGRLPAKYQVPVVLCYLEGKTHEQTAIELGWPKGTVAGRLSRARDLLRRRLTRRGLALSSGIAFSGLSVPADAGAAAPLIQATSKLAPAFAAGKKGAVSSNIALYAEGAIRAMFLTKIKIVAIAVFSLALIGAGAGAVLNGTGSAGDPKGSGPPAALRTQDAKPVESPPVDKKPRGILVVSQCDGVVTDLVARADEKVKRGQLLVKLDDRLARNRLRSAKAKLASAHADVEGAVMTFKEAFLRHDAAKKLFGRTLISAEEMREKKLASDKSQTEVAGRRAQAEVAEIEVENAQIILDMQQISSPVDGVIRTIFKRPGEGVKALEPVMEIVPAKKAK